MTVKAEVLSKVAMFNGVRPYDSSRTWTPFSTAVTQYYTRAGTEFEELARQTVERLVIEEFMSGLAIEHYERLPALSGNYPRGFFDIDEIFSEPEVIRTILSTSESTFRASFQPVGAAVAGQPIQYESKLLSGWAKGINAALAAESGMMQSINEFCRHRYRPWMDALLRYGVGRVIQTYAERRGELRRGVYDLRGWTRTQLNKLIEFDNNASNKKFSSVRIIVRGVTKTKVTSYRIFSKMLKSDARSSIHITIIFSLSVFVLRRE